MPDLLPDIEVGGPARASAGRARPTVTARGAGAAAAARLRRYDVHSLPVEVTADEPALLDRVHAVLGHLGLVPREAPGGADAVVLRFSDRPGAVRLPAGALPAAEQDGIRAWSAGEDRLYLECDDGHAARLDLAAGAGECVLPPPPAPPRKAFVTYALLLLLRRRRLFGLHASGVVRDGAGWLFVAACGSGKSTQTYNLARQGWEYLGDDALLLRAGADAVQALALRRDLLLDPTPPGAYPELAGIADAAPVGAKGKRRVAVPALYPDRLVDACVPRVLVFPEIVPEPRSRLVPLGRADTLLRLMGQSVVLNLDPGVIPRHLDVLGRLAAQAQSWRLLAGRDLKERPELVAALLAGIDPAPPPPHPQ